VTRDPEDETLLDIHPLVVEVAAVASLDGKDRFSAEVFLSHIERIKSKRGMDRSAETIKVPAP
jgi:hypothetical protein